MPMIASVAMIEIGVRDSNTMSGARHRRKGNRIERELVDAHKLVGIYAERYPLSGASRFRGSGHDLDVYLFGRDEARLRPRRRRARTAAASCSLSAGSVNSTCCF